MLARKTRNLTEDFWKTQEKKKSNMVYFALTSIIAVCTAAPAPPAFQPAALPKLELGADNCIDMFGMGISVSVRTELLSSFFLEERYMYVQCWLK